MHDLEYQNTSEILSARWHGFSDTGSGIVQYYWCIGKSPVVNEEHSKTECSVREWQNVGMHTTVSKKNSINVTDG